MQLLPFLKLPMISCSWCKACKLWSIFYQGGKQNLSFIPSANLPFSLLYISAQVYQIIPPGHSHSRSGCNLVCCTGWAVTKTITLPLGPSIAPLQQAKPTLGNPLKCLFGPVAGALHLTDTMRKGKWHQ